MTARSLHRLICVMLIAVFAIVFAAGRPALADYDAGKLAAAKTAADALATKAQNSEKTGNAPRESDPAVKALLDTVYDTRDIEAGRTVPFEALSPLSERMLAGVKVGLIYMLAGTGTNDLAALSADPSGGEKVNLNVIKFAPEMGRFFDFQLRVQAAIIDAVLARLASAPQSELSRPNFQKGLADIRQGSQRTVSGVIETLAVNGLTENWRRDRLPALTATAPRLAKFLQPEQKKELRDLALACAGVMGDPQVKAALQNFATTLGS